MSNDLFADALPVVIDADGDTFISAPVPNAGFGTEPGEYGYGQRSAWWWYQPASDGTADLDLELTAAGASTDTLLVVFSGADKATDTLAGLTAEDQNDDFYGNPWSRLSSFPVTAGRVYYIQASSPYDEDMDYVLRVTGPAHGGTTTGAVLALPPIALSMGTGGNDDFIDAEPVHIAYDGGDYESEELSNVGAGTEPGEPDNGRTRSLWWRYAPLGSGTATFDTELVAGAPDTSVAVYTGHDVATLSQVAFSAAGSVSGKVTLAGVPVTAGTVYHVAVAGSYDAPVLLRVVGPATLTVGGGFQLPPIGVTATQEKIFLGVDDTHVIPADLGAQLGAPIVWKLLKLAPIEVAAGLRAPQTATVRRLLVDPVNGAVVPILRPRFSVAMQPGGDVYPTSADVDVQVATDTAFTTPVTFHATTPLLVGPNAVSVPADVDLPAGVPLYWRARLVLYGTAQGWSAPATFRIDASVGDGLTDVTFAVHAGLTDPHLWHVSPAVGVPGSQVTVSGVGFPANPVVKINGVPAVVVSHTLVPASSTDPEHDELVIVVPAMPGPGGPLTVEGDDA